MAFPVVQNPQMDVQAQDRAHRIGQTKPVLIFRLISAHTIEEKIMQKATEKRKLEALVIAKGKFKMPAADAGSKRTTMAEMAADLLRLEGEQIDVLPTTTQAGDENILSDADLEALLDRSPEVFADRGTGWRSSAKGQAAFAVFEPPPDAGSDALAGMMGEETEE
ncbi:SNF2 family DNA-dependent ATPase [Mycena venus]|uniref:SNF2 family DNA-dependent ATPase n=1 Tax=Mycena venus TaxID=2733690 RepID=A0A8H6XWM8_9AGAR|nr:SNF2 family DNA-dependent ATPase [Mycena venus]